MSKSVFAFILVAAGVLSLLWAHEGFASSSRNNTESNLKVLAVETFLADIARNVAGSRVKVNSLLPVGADPHSYDARPADVLKVAESNVLIINGAGFEGFMNRLLRNAGTAPTIIDASAGIASRTLREGEQVEAGKDGEKDPHFWMSPLNAIRYVENIRDGLSRADPDGKDVYAVNAQSYISRLKDLDHWIEDRVRAIPENRRLLVTNHESLGYFADRYGFKVVGTIVPSVSSEASPSARQLAHLVERIKETGVHAIFLESGSNRQLPQQVAKETGVKVEELFDHSISGPEGPAPDYIAMMKYDTMTIVSALK